VSCEPVSTDPERISLSFNLIRLKKRHKALIGLNESIKQTWSPLSLRHTGDLPLVRHPLGHMATLWVTFNSIQFICIAQFHKLQICLGVLYNLYT